MEHKLTFLRSDFSPRQENLWCRPWWKSKPLVSVKIWVWNSRKNQIKRYSLNFSDYQDCDPKEKNKDFFNWILVCGCCVSDSDLDGGNRTCSGWDLKVWISITMNENSAIWNFWTVSNMPHGSQQKICRQLNCFQQTENFLMQTLVGEIITVVTQKYVFDYQEHSKILNNF